MMARAAQRSLNRTVTVDELHRIHIFPVRHHSPAASAELAALIRKLRPRLILIEGPIDATHLIPLIASDESVPPLAVYSYLPDARAEHFPAQAMWPFCSYSPEYVAIKEGARTGARIAFCDLPSFCHFPGIRIGAVENQMASPEAQTEKEYFSEDEQLPATAANEMIPFGSAFANRLAEKAGFRSFEEFWEARWEMGSPGAFTPALLKYAHLLRLGEIEELAGEHHRVEQERTGLREAMMWRSTVEAIRQGYDPGEILVVLGAYHAVVLHPEIVDTPPSTSLLDRLIEADPASFQLAPVDPAVIPEEPKRKRRQAGDDDVVLTLIPYSYLRLSEQTGYGAGNRAPAFYRIVWEYMQQRLDNGDTDAIHPFSAAAREMLILLRRELDRHGQNTSLADAIEAYRLAQTLASIRDKPAPGIAEIEQAGIACMGRGADGVVRPVLQRLLVGDTIGRISSRLMVQSALQREFYTTVQETKLPLKDIPVNKDLALTNRTDQAASLLLHRLKVLDVPFARLKSSGDRAYNRLIAVRESWEVRWTPLVDTRLVELSAYGSSLARVGARFVLRWLEDARSIDAASELLLSAALAGLEDAYEPALRRCDALGADKASFIHLAQACHNLAALLQYRQVRTVPLGPVAALLMRLYRRAAAGLASAGRVDDQAAQQTGEAMKMLYNVLQQQSQLDPQPYIDALIQVRDDDAAERDDGVEPMHPFVGGLALSLLVLLGALDGAGVARHLNLALSPAAGAWPAALYLSGFLSLNKTYLVRSRPVVESLNDYLTRLEPDEFMRVLPILRRTLSVLSTGEKRYLLELLSELLGFMPAMQEHLPVSAELLAKASLVDAEIAELLAALTGDRKTGG